MRDALRGIVHHHRQLIGPQAVGAAQHKVAHRLQHVLLLRTQASVAPLRWVVQLQIVDHALHIQAPSPRRFALQTLATRARIHRSRVPCALLLLRVFNLFARTAAGVGPALGHQVVQGGLIGLMARGLPQHGFIGHQATSGQLRQQGLVGAGHAARRVHVFHAHQPSAAMGASIQPTGQCSHQRARMQQTRGGGGETTPVGGWGSAQDPDRAVQSSMAKDSPKPLTNASSTRWPSSQSPHKPNFSEASHRWFWPSGCKVLA